MTCPEPNVLAALDELPETERAAVVDHAASCDSCRGVVMAVMATAHSPGPPGAPPSDTPAQIDRYRVDSRIGAGAMGVVFAAYDPELDRRVAVKLLRAGGSAERLRREAQVLAKLTHPNVVAVYDAGAFGDGAFVAMALVDGKNLRIWLEKPRSNEQIIDAIIQAARGVAVAHAAGIVHRDIKPDNIFVGRDGVVLVGDFGLARPPDQREGPRTGELADSNELTQTGMIIGTPVYMAPEQIAGEATSASDQFSLCVTAWEALYGARPFRGATLDAIAASIERGPPAEPKSKVPKRVHAAIRRGLAADPADRHASVAALVTALEKRRRLAPIVVAAVAIVFAAAVITFAAMHRDEPADPVALAIARCDAEPPLQMHGDLGPPLGSSVVKRVDAYAQQWTELRHTACVAAARREITEPANAAIRACLDRRTETLHSIVSDLKSYAPMMALAYIEGLEPIESCRHAPARPAPTPDVAALQTTIDQFAVAERTDPALGGLDVEPLVRGADSVDAATAAEALYVAGVALTARGRDAEAMIARSAMLADKAQDDRIRVRAASALSEVLAKTGRAGDAITQRDIAASALSRIEDPLGTIAVQHATVVIARSQNDARAQIAPLRAILDLQRRRFGEDSLAVVNATAELAMQLQLAHDSTAQAVADDARRIAAKLAPDGSIEMLLEGIAVNGVHKQVEVSERLVAAMRRDNPAELPTQLLTLSYLYEQVGDLQGSLNANLEAVSLFDNMPANERDVSKQADGLFNAATMCHDLAERATNKEARADLLSRGVALIDRQLALLHGNTMGSALRGRILLMQERYADALPLLNRALTDAEAEQPRNANRVAIRAFALAQALWETGGPRDRARARALVAEARAQFAIAKTGYEADRETYGFALDPLARHIERLDAWVRAHPEAAN